MPEEGQTTLRPFYATRAAAALLIVAVVALGIGAGVFVERRLVEAERSAQVATARDQVFQIAAGIQNRIAFHEMLSTAIANAVRIDPLFDQQKFSSMVAPFFKADPAIVNIGISEGYVVKYVHPYLENSMVLGLDYRESPAQFETIERIRQTGEQVFDGPVDLVQGSTGYIQRAPIFKPSNGSGEEFWGVVSVVVEESAFVETTRDLVVQGYSAGVRKLGERPGTHSFLWGEPDIFARDPLTQLVNLGEQTWEIGVVPTGGWSAASRWRPQIVFVAALATLIVMAIAEWTRRLASTRRRAWEQLSTAIEAIDDGFALYDAEDRLVMCNSRYKSYYNASAHLMVPGARFEDIIRGGVAVGQYPQAEGREEAWIAERLAMHRNPGGPIEQRLEDGRWLKISEAKTTDGSTVGFRVDVTDLKTAQREAERANSVKTEFLNTISHEIRTPLSAIIGFASMLLSLTRMPQYTKLVEHLQKGSAKEAEAALADVVSMVETYSERVDANGQHLLNLINDILYLNTASRIAERGEFTRVDIGPLVRGVETQLSSIAHQKGVALTADCEDVVVKGDERRLKQVLLNIIGNALKFTDEGAVHVACGIREGRACIRVSDTGCGIPREHLDEIFESFTQVDSSITRKYGGTGLGLAISRDIVERHGGSIEVESELDKGSRFTIWLDTADTTEKAAA